ncbi:hypothetical protein DL96DRAFT_1625474 [Flagelloscypha sp. PMI_526]|nr:hypothetical protein DL96DRAFT_1625474 [Flagelloscypha sp. PMI_526]
MAGATPRVGTEQQPDLESLTPPPPSTFQFIQKSFQSFKDDPVYYFIMWSLWSIIFLIAAGAVSAYNVLVGVTGRHILDHYSLWQRALPPNKPSIPDHSKDGDLIAAATAGVLSAILIASTFSFLDWLSDRPLPSKLILIEKFIAASDGNWVWGGSFILCLWIPVAPAAAMVHTHFEHVTPKAILAIYGMGTPIIAPAILGGIYAGYYTIPGWRKWWDNS